MSSGGTATDGANGGGQPRLQVMGQYIKDLSFENPGMPQTAMTAQRPQIDLNVDLQARQMDEEHYEVELKLRVSAQSENQCWM